MNIISLLILDIQLSGGNLNDSSDNLHSIPFNCSSTLGSHVQIPLEVSKEKPIGQWDMFTLNVYNVFFGVAVYKLRRHDEIFVEFDFIV